MRILIVGDSLCMPRPTTPIETTWPHLLIRNTQHEIYTFIRRGMTTNDIMKIREDLYNYKPDLIIFQVGIVDCTRKALPVSLSKYVSIRRLISPIHYTLTSIGNSSVSFSCFSDNIQTITTECKRRKIDAVFIKIAPAGEYLKRKVYMAEEDIELYNSALTKFIDPYLNQTDFIISTDGHHLNTKGHQLVSRAVSSYLEHGEYAERTPSPHHIIEEMLRQNTVISNIINTRAMQ